MPLKRSAPVWLFDLDNTLHNATPAIFPHINRAMRDYIARHLAVDVDTADRLRETYWQRYGATLLGLIRHHDTDPRHFLAETHRFPDLQRLLHFEKPVIQALKRLPGRKILFSNAPRRYIADILRLTGLGPCFSACYGVEDLRFQPKPMARGFRRLLRREKLHPRQCILVEDSLENLVTAKRLGMATVWINGGHRRSPWVDLHCRRVTELPARWPRRSTTVDR